MTNAIDVVVIGGGPVGLYAASLLEKEGADFLLLEGSDVLGGQITKLYPKKLVVDVPEFPIGPAETIVESLIKQIDMKRVILSSPVHSIDTKNEKIIVKTPMNSYAAKRIIIATGLGRSVPRPLGVPNESNCHEILYELKDPSLLKGKSVIVFGGGDSALDWARDLSDVAKRVSLVHRRTEFRGNPKTIEGKRIDLYLPYTPLSIKTESGKLMGVSIKNVNDGNVVYVSCDYVLVNYGQVPSPSTFGLPLSSEGFGLIAGGGFEIAPGIFAAGDIVYDPNRKKRMAPAFEEVREILSSPKWKAWGSLE